MDENNKIFFIYTLFTHISVDKNNPDVGKEEKQNILKLVRFVRFACAIVYTGRTPTGTARWDTPVKEHRHLAGCSFFILLQEERA